MNKVAVIGIAGQSVFLPVEKFHTGGETVEAQSVRFEYGGKGFNQAVAAARRGAEVSFLAAVGKEGGAEIEKFLKNEKIKVTLAEKDEPTAFAAIITDKTGANRVTVFQGARLEKKDVSAFEREIAEADVLLLSNEVKEDINALAAEIAERNGVKIVLNPAPARKTKKSLLQKVFLFTPNEHEAEGLEDYKNVVQTLGNKGCLLKETGVLIPPTKDIAVDTTGAGDTFNGVLAAEIAAGASLFAAAEAAAAAAGKSVTRRGAVSSIPFYDEYKIR